MSRTMFVNPEIFSNPGRRRKKGKKSKRRRAGKRRVARAPRRSRRRNAGITPFIQNPLILSNPRRSRRRSRRRNPSLGSLKGILSQILTDGAGAMGALGVSAVATNKITNPWFRRGSQLGAAVLGGALVSTQSRELGHSFRAAMFYPLFQDIAIDLFGTSIAFSSTSKEADVDAIAADLEDVLDEMSNEDGAWQDVDEDDNPLRAW